MTDNKTAILNLDANAHLKITPPATLSDVVGNLYAAGMVAEAGATHVLDATAPTLSAVSTSSGGTLAATASEKAKGYWVAVAQGSAAPTVAQIKAGANYAAVTMVAHGSGALPGTGTVGVSSDSSGTQLGVIHVTLPGATTSVSTVTVDTGSATFTASEKGQAVAGLKNGIVVVSGATNSQVTVDATGTNATTGVSRGDGERQELHPRAAVEPVQTRCRQIGLVDG